jgi:hypothetical protein
LRSVSGVVLVSIALIPGGILQSAAKLARICNPTFWLFSG